ncbi:MAG: hypothetical protein O3A01_05535, partial [bacterium]|nr:hypothetical protein [bacterium]
HYLVGGQLYAEYEDKMPTTAGGGIGGSIVVTYLAQVRSTLEPVPRLAVQPPQFAAGDFCVSSGAWYQSQSDRDSGGLDWVQIDAPQCEDYNAASAQVGKPQYDAAPRVEAGGVQQRYELVQHDPAGPVMSDNPGLLQAHSIYEVSGADRQLQFNSPRLAGAFCDVPVDGQPKRFNPALHQGLRAGTQVEQDMAANLDGLQHEHPGFYNRLSEMPVSVVDRIASDLRVVARLTTLKQSHEVLYNKFIVGSSIQALHDFVVKDPTASELLAMREQISKYKYDQMPPKSANCCVKVVTQCLPYAFCFPSCDEKQSVPVFACAKDMFTATSDKEIPAWKRAFAFCGLGTAVMATACALGHGFSDGGLFSASKIITEPGLVIAWVGICIGGGVDFIGVREFYQQAYPNGCCSGNRATVAPETVIDQQPGHQALPMANRGTAFL